MAEYSCWFCGRGIERSDDGAILITLEGLWRWHDASRADDDPFQQVYAHSACAKVRLKGATMDIEPSVFGEDG